MVNRATSRSLIKILIAVVVVVVVVGYAIFAFRDIARGPSIAIIEPTNGETFATSTVELKGVSERAQFISLNGRPILIDENGAFNEEIVLSSGYNVAIIEARDKFGHTTIDRLELVRSTKHELEVVLSTTTASTSTSVHATSSKATTIATSTMKKR